MNVVRKTVITSTGLEGISLAKGTKVLNINWKAVRGDFYAYGATPDKALRNIKLRELGDETLYHIFREQEVT